MLDKSPANCRQLFHRAKHYLAERRHRFDTSRETQLRLMGRFLVACQEGDMQGLMDILAQDVTSWGDGGGKAVAARRPVYVVEAVARMLLSLATKSPANCLLSFHDLNCIPAVLIMTCVKMLDVRTVVISGA